MSWTLRTTCDKFGQRRTPNVDAVVITVPDDSTRWRCGRCGNLTRFDVVRTTKARQYWHVDLGGNPAIEQSESLRDEIESVTCRWCGASDAIELVPRATDA